MAQQAQDDYYGDPAEVAMAYAAAVNDEVRDLVAAGADVVQIDEPYLQARPEPAREYALPAIDRALEGIEADTVLHTCFGYAHIVHTRLSGLSVPGRAERLGRGAISIEAAQPNLDCSMLRELPDKQIVLGVLDLDDPAVETPETVAARIRAALEHVPAERLIVAPDCGMKYLPRELAFAKLARDGRGRAIVRSELG